MESEIIPHTDKMTYLGVILDKRLTWKPYIIKVRNKTIEVLEK